jgi:hypothetical protein
VMGVRAEVHDELGLVLAVKATGVDFAFKVVLGAEEPGSASVEWAEYDKGWNSAAKLVRGEDAVEEAVVAMTNLIVVITRFGKAMGVSNGAGSSASSRRWGKGNSVGMGGVQDWGRVRAGGVSGHQFGAATQVQIGVMRWGGLGWGIAVVGRGVSRCFISIAGIHKARACRKDRRGKVFDGLNIKGGGVGVVFGWVVLKVEFAIAISSIIRIVVTLVIKDSQDGVIIGRRLGVGLNRDGGLNEVRARIIDNVDVVG